MTKIIDGKALSNKIRENLKQQIKTDFLDKNLNPPKLVVVLVGDDPASKIYTSNKAKACESVGIKSETINLPSTTSQAELNNLIKRLNADKTVNGILLQLPLPNGLNSDEAINLIDPSKDVDGLTSISLGKLVAGEKNAVGGCTPSGIIEMLKEYGVNPEGKNVVIINRSILVGKPLALMLTSLNATVTLCHSKTQNLKSHTKHADILITAVGKKNFITADMIKKNAVVIDVAIVRDENGKVCGDVDFENVKQKARLITPVPGGCGPMTITMLLKNTIFATKYLQ